MVFFSQKARDLHGVKTASTKSRQVEHRDPSEECRREDSERKDLRSKLAEDPLQRLRLALHNGAPSPASAAARRGYA